MAIHDLLTSAEAQRLGYALLDSLWQGAAVCGLAGVGLWMLRRASAGARYWVAVGAMVMMVTWPVGTFLFQTTSGSAAPAGVLADTRGAVGQAVVIDNREANAALDGIEKNSSGKTAEPAKIAGAGATAVATGSSVMARPSPLPAPRGQWTMALWRARTQAAIPYMTFAWACGVLLLSIWQLGGWLALQRLRLLGTSTVSVQIQEIFQRTAERMQVTRAVRVARSALVETPVVIGWLKPMILLPVAMLSGLSPTQLEAILAHELAHIKRHDYLVNMLQVVAETLMFYHPGIWWLSRRIRREREMACDDMVTAVCSDRRAYAEALLSVEELRRPGVLALAAAGGEMKSRIVRILGAAPIAPRAHSLAAVALTVVLMLLPLVLARFAASAATPVPQTVGTRISGDVVGSDGKPSSGANVILSRYTSRSPQQDVMARTITDRSGHFSLLMPPALPHEAVGSIFAYMPGVGFSKEVSAAAEQFHLQLATAADVQLTLQKPDGAPVGGVRVRPTVIVFDDSTSYLLINFVELPKEVADLFAATTDAAGHCLIHGLPRGTYARFDTDDTRYAHFPELQEVLLEGTANPVIAPPYTLLPGSSISGTLTDPESAKPLVGWYIGADAIDPGADIRGWALTDAKGHFAIEQLEGGEFYVYCRGDADDANPPALWVAPPVKLKVGNGETATANFSMTHGGFVKGQAFDAKTRRPISGISIALAEKHPDIPSPIYHSRHTDADGNFEFRVAPGDHNLYLFGAPPIQYHVSPDAKTELDDRMVTVRAGETATTQFNLVPEVMAEGLVIGPDGRPAARAFIIYSTGGMTGEKSVESDEQGHFRYPVNAGAVLTARTAALATAAPVTIVDEHAITLQLLADATFNLTVALKDGNGKVVPGAGVELQTLAQGRSGSGSRFGEITFGRERMADTQGIVRFDSLDMDQRYDLTVLAPGFEDADSPLPSVRPGDSREQTLRIIPGVPYVRIGGIVVDAQGNPAGGIDVEIATSPADRRRTRTRADGQFDVVVEHHATASLYIYGSDGATLVHTLVQGDERNLRLVLPAAAPASAPAVPPATAPATRAATRRVTGDVIGLDGKPAADAQVCVVSTNASGGNKTVGSAHVGKDGKFSLEFATDEIGKEDYVRNIFAFVPGAAVSSPASITDDEIHLQLIRAVDLQVTFQETDGKPVAGIHVWPEMLLFPRNGFLGGGVFYLSPDVAAGFSATTDQEGKCVLHGLPRDARVRLAIDDDRYARLSIANDIALEGGGDVVIAPPIPLLKAATISGTVVNPETGKPMAGMQVSAQASDASGGSGWGSALTDAGGHFAIGRLEPAPYLVELHLSDGVTGPTSSWTAAAAEVEVREGEHAVANFVLTHGGLLKGQVRDAATGKPILGVSVGLQGPSRPKSGGAVESRTVDAQGNFDFRVPPGEQYPYFQGPVPMGYLAPPHQGMQTVMVKEGETVTANFELTPEPTLEGTVVGPDGKPVAGAAVTYDAKDAGPVGQKWTQSDARGKFRYPAAAGGMLKATFKDLATAAPVKVTDDTPVMLRLSADATFTLIVELKDENGKVLPNAKATLVIMQGNYGFSDQGHKADANGIVRFTSLPMDGAYSVMGAAPAHRESDSRVNPVQPGGPREQTVSLILRTGSK